MSTPSIRVPEADLSEVIEWADNNARADVTDHEDGTYEQGVRDALFWALGYIQSRPDQ